MTESDPFGQIREYRVRLLARLDGQAAGYAALLEAFSEPEWHTHRTADGATCHQILAHVRDAEALAYWPRIRRILTEAEPTLDPFPRHRWSLDHYDASAGPADILQAWARTRAEGLARLRTLTPPEWGRLGFHPPSGPRTVQWWVERVHTHARVHLTELQALAAQPAPPDPYAHDLP